MKINYKEYSINELYGLLGNLDKEDSDLIAEVTKEIQHRESDPDYQRQILVKWKRFRFFSISLVVSIPLMLFFSFMANRVSTFFGYLMFACVVIFIFSVLYTRFWKCPQCGNSLSTGMIGIFGPNTHFKNKCTLCGYKVTTKD
jgi:lipopolysaccharide export LptBFGC system permease protein LptF